jgi:hypothetical protein
MKRKCSRCKVDDLTDENFYPSMKTICKTCHRKWMVDYNMQPNRTQNPRIKTYQRVKDLLKKACLRIREEQLGLRNTPLLQSDRELMYVVSSRMKPGMTWERYNIDWKITTPLLMAKVRKNVTKSQLLDPNDIYTAFKEDKEALQ